VGGLADQTRSIGNTAGDTSSIPGYYRFEVQRYTVDAGARLRCDTGPISHSSTLQVTRYRDELSRGIISGAPVLSNIYHPVQRPKPSIAKPDAPKVSATELSGVAIADTLSILDQRVQVTVGLRKQNIQSHNYNAAGAVTTAYDAGKTTPLFGAVVKPWEHVSFYYNYLEGLSKGDVAPSNAANAGEIFAPYVSRQHEVGVKFDYGTFMSTLALFQIQKPTGELAQGRFSVQGEQRNRGLELGRLQLLRRCARRRDPGQAWRRAVPDLQIHRRGRVGQRQPGGGVAALRRAFAAVYPAVSPRPLRAPSGAGVCRLSAGASRRVGGAVAADKSQVSISWPMAASMVLACTPSRARIDTPCRKLS